MCRRVPCRFVVSVPSFCVNVVVVAACFLLLAAVLYTSFQGLIAEVKVHVHECRYLCMFVCIMYMYIYVCLYYVCMYVCVYVGT